VCEQHQNVVLLTSALPGNHTAQDLMAHVVSDLKGRDCMFHQCDNCPGKSALRQYLMKLLDTNDMDGDDIVKYQQWLHTDRTTLVDLQATSDVFVDTVCDACEKLCSHHYITKSKAQYLRDQKDLLSAGTSIVLLDFAEN
jgi:hypothetical protein